LLDGDGDRDPTPAACGDSRSFAGVDPLELNGSDLARPRDSIQVREKNLLQVGFEMTYASQEDPEHWHLQQSFGFEVRS
jgi:hypothetical protein